MFHHTTHFFGNAVGLIHLFDRLIAQVIWHSTLDTAFLVSWAPHTEGHHTTFVVPIMPPHFRRILCTTAEPEVLLSLPVHSCFVFGPY